MNLPPLGNPGRPVALVTKTLLFVADSSSALFGHAGISGPAKFRAYDKANGKLIAQVDLPVGATGGPMTYMADGNQYIVVPIGGKGYGAGWVGLGVGGVGIFSEAQAQRGQNIYRAKCAGCHAADLTGEHAPALRGDSFWSEWEQETVHSLYGRIIGNMPPDDPGSLAPKDVVDVLAYLLQVNGLPAASRAHRKRQRLKQCQTATAEVGQRSSLSSSWCPRSARAHRRLLGKPMSSSSTARSIPRQAAPREGSIAIGGNKILRVGSTPEIMALRGPKTEVIDAQGSAVVPGFDDIHTHLLEGGLALGNVRLERARTLQEVQSRIGTFAKAHPDRAWIQGMGWGYEAFPGNLPTRQELDAVISDRPAVMECFDGHSVWVNSKALALAGIDKTTPDPPNGFIVRDPTTGEPTGLLKETPAVALVHKVVPSPPGKRAIERIASRFGGGSAVRGDQYHRHHQHSRESGSLR